VHPLRAAHVEREHTETPGDGGDLADDEAANTERGLEAVEGKLAEHGHVFPPG
jgi:hypothetical protein